MVLVDEQGVYGGLLEKYSADDLGTTLKKWRRSARESETRPWSRFPPAAGGRRGPQIRKRWMRGCLDIFEMQYHRPRCRGCHRRTRSCALASEPDAVAGWGRRGANNILGAYAQGLQLLLRNRRDEPCLRTTELPRSRQGQEQSIERESQG
ncbi:hypothetical protein BD310DRAFT_1031913 [Dichomitus squalens]|uniref:Uncharacterized protein n=1 Tax=Dichomitus squalens TaxID=114155 RepID=A0A4Q9PKL7_9APHY|nr:hypothetical protein BD310DRAFT_1031913 [Dichomitus squalens]